MKTLDQFVAECRHCGRPVRLHESIWGVHASGGFGPMCPLSPKELSINLQKDYADYKRGIEALRRAAKSANYLLSPRRRRFE